MTPERYQRLQTCLMRRQPDLTVVMENVHKSHNFAAIMRSCDAVGIHEVHAVTTNGEIAQHHQTSAGANKWVNTHCYQDVKEPMEILKSRGFQLLAADTDMTAIDFRLADYTKPTAIIMGSELFGISPQTKSAVDQSITIPMQGLVESFNVSVATALILYEAQRQREAAGFYQKSRLTSEVFKKTLFEWCYPEIAAYCRRKETPYPELDEEGYITDPSKLNKKYTQNDLK